MYNGIFTISLDFELYWGVLDSKPLNLYKNNILGAHRAVEKLLKLFERYDIHVTWAILGYLYFEDFDELERGMPPMLPTYEESSFSSYEYFDRLRKLDSRLLFAKEDIVKIKNTAFQEIGSHTFSHYYCLEKGQNKEQFLSDIFYAKKKAKEIGVDLKSIVFPRDQYSKECLEILKKLGFIAYRGNPKSFIYAPRDQKNKQNILRKTLLFADSHINLTGYHCRDIDPFKTPTDIPSSRFLRPVSNNPVLNVLRLKRIKAQMAYAAKNRRLFHLWWHPHNFGVKTEENLKFLEDILIFYKEMQRKYNMLSLSMKEAAVYAREFAGKREEELKGYGYGKDSWVLGLSK